MTECCFNDDAYQTECPATVQEIRDGAAVLDRTVFYPLGGGQPGDCGWLITGDGRRFPVSDTRKGDHDEILHLAESFNGLQPGDTVTARIDWERRYAHMRMHTALHLLGSLLQYPVTGGNISVSKSRLDFDMEDTVDKMALTAGLNELVQRDLSVETRWITDEELDAQPELVRTMSVKPPRGAGRVRLLQIGDIDLQPCGGTHVRRTAEIGPLRVSKVEKKGRRNRRVNVVFDA